MSSALDILPADLLVRLDAALPAFTQSAIRAEFLQGVYLFSAGLFICLAFMFFAWYLKREGIACLAAALFGFGLMVVSIPSVVAPDMVVAREILAEM